MKSRNITLWAGIAGLIALEQGIKLLINRFFLDASVPLLKPLFYFEPMFNRHYSWFNSMLRIEGSRWVHIVFVGLVIVLIFLFYRYARRRMGARRFTDTMFSFLLAGAVCSFIDKLFWNGSLDYIRMDGLFTFDLKDLYIDVFIGLLIYALLFRGGELKRFLDSRVIEDFFRSLCGLRQKDSDGKTHEEKPGPLDM
jgi:signal peptidase II